MDDALHLDCGLVLEPYGSSGDGYQLSSISRSQMVFFTSANLKEMLEYVKRREAEAIAAGRMMAPDKLLETWKKELEDDSDSDG